MKLQQYSDIIETLGENVKHLVWATSVKAMRLRDLNTYKNETLWKDNELVNEVCRLVETEQDTNHCHAKMKIPGLLYNGVAQASPRLENIALVFMGQDMVVSEPWKRDCVAKPKNWLYTIETELDTEAYPPHRSTPTKDLSIGRYREFFKSPDLKSIQGMHPTERIMRLRQRLEEICPRAVVSSNRQSPAQRNPPAS